MKKFFLALAMLCFVAQSANAGIIYENATYPTTVSLQTKSCSKRGSATCRNFLGLVTLGDCSYHKAMKNGRISQIHHHDTQKYGWFFYRQITTRVYGY